MDVALCQNWREEQVLALNLFNKPLIFIGVCFSFSRKVLQGLGSNLRVLSAPWIKLELGDVAVVVIYFM